MAYFTTEYTIHFDDTMAYGSHHFLTAFKFQCASRESFLFGEQVFDLPGVREALEGIHLLTADAYSRNLSPAKLGDRLAILLSLEDWGRSSARFCYRVLGEQGQNVCAGFQTLICADAKTQSPIPLPPPLQQALDAMREIEEPQAVESFRNRVLAGGSKLESLFGKSEREVALRFLSQRYPSPKIVTAMDTPPAPEEPSDETQSEDALGISNLQAWVFAGQAAFDSKLLSDRVSAYAHNSPAASEELKQCAAIAQEWIGGDAHALVSGSAEQCAAAVLAKPELSQVAIHLQNVLGALLWQARGNQPGILLGHSFGEIAALGVGGCFDLWTGIHIVCMRVRAIANYAPPGGGLLVVSSDRDTVITEAALLSLGQVVIAGRNHATQTIASGPSDELEHLKKHLVKIGVNAAMIDSPTSFHHPILRVAAAHWLEELRTLSFKAPSLPVYSPVGRRFISTEDDIAAILSSQLLKPFDLQRGLVDVVQAGATMLVDCGSSGALARLISKAGTGDIEVCQVVVDATLDEPMKSSPQQSLVPPVAIVGQGCILPGGASSPEKLFAAISEQRNGIVDQRHFDPHWSEDFYAEKLSPDRSNSHLTGRVNDEDILVPAGIDRDIFNGFTRAQRLLCIAVAPCIASLKGADRILCLIGATADGFEDQDDVASLLFMGMDPTDDEIHARMDTARSALHTPHSAVQEVFDRIVRPGLKVTLVDAACASSLYTVALGMQALETNKTDAVIAGGFFCPGPGNSCLFSQFRGTTSTGCRPFDAQADGVVFSEGAALVTLRRVVDAERLGLTMFAKVRGAGLSSDGRSSSANVPQSKGQLLSLHRCYANYAIDPASIDAIEGHGTSTPVGDSTEVETLRQFFSGHRSQPIPLHSLKGLLGHAGWAAGTASMIAVCEYLRRGVFPAQAGFRNPSSALQAAAGTLMVATQAVSLPRHQGRIAIDGFGFGGANAHLVLEASTSPGTLSGQPVARMKLSERDNELVFVAYHQELPTLATPQGLRFDRGDVKLPKGHIVLPELADDMDISQTLTVIVAGKVIAQIPQFDEQLRRETSLILAMRGKTERGIEATARIMAHRFRRKLEGNVGYVKLLDASYDASRPSGPYTLQCMMPNVSAGRAALLLNLNGPNFVVDSAASSLEAALSSAALLLQSGEEDGTKLALIAAVEANSCGVSGAESNAGAGEFAAAFAVTTRRFAQDRGLKIILSLNEALESASHDLEHGSVANPFQTKTQALLESLDTACAPNRESSAPIAQLEQVSDASNCQIHIPVWVEKPLPTRPTESLAPRLKSTLVIASAQSEYLEQILAVLPKYSDRLLIAMVGKTSHELQQWSGNPMVLPIDLSNAQLTSSALQKIQEFSADIVTLIEPVATWDFTETLASIAGDNSLCEFLFLVAQRECVRLKQGQVELWGLLIDAWKGEVHPSSGPIAGLLKSINREFPSARTGTICVGGLDLSAALACMQAERAQGAREQEVVWDKNVRLVRRLRQPCPNTKAPRQVRLDSRSVIVATGGARGVTAVMLDALLRDYQCTVIALGRSPLEDGPDNWNDAAVEQEYYQRCLRENPNVSAADLRKSLDAARARWEAHHTILQLSALGGQVEYMVADVTDPTQVANAMQHIVSRYGRIDLVVHGAGVQKSKRIEHRSLAEFRQTFSVKVGGLRNILECCASLLGKMVNTHVLTSAYSVFGNDGQHDYGAANEALDRLCAMQAVGNTATSSSMAWLAWEGIGMTRGSEYRALAKNRGLSVVDAQLGKRLFRQVLAGRFDAAIHVPMTPAEHNEYGIKTVPKSLSGSKGRVLEVGVELASIECLPFHRIRDIPTLPGAWILDQLVNTGLQLATGAERITNVAVENLSFMRFVRLANNLEPNLRVIAEKTDRGIDVWMVADVRHPSGIILTKDVVCAMATLSFGGENVQPTASSIFASKGHRSKQFVTDPYCDNSHSEVALTGPFDCLRDIEISENLRSAKFLPNRMRHQFSDIPTLLLDAAWRVGAMYAVAGRSDLFVPVRIGRMFLPVERNSNCESASAWEIRSTVPRSENRDVRWDRTEVFDRAGKLKMIVEDALAMRLH